MKNIYTIVLKKHRNEWLALCLDMGILKQGGNKEEALSNIKKTIFHPEKIDNQNEMRDVPDWRRQLYDFFDKWAKSFNE
jgi:hypothetical protein